MNQFSKSVKCVTGLIITVINREHMMSVPEIRQSWSVEADESRNSGEGTKPFSSPRLLQLDGERSATAGGR